MEGLRIYYFILAFNPAIGDLLSWRGRSAKKSPATQALKLSDKSNPRPRPALPNPYNKAVGMLFEEENKLSKINNPRWWFESEDSLFRDGFSGSGCDRLH